MDIVEFKEAIAYVNGVSKDGSCNFGDERQINQLFRAMDADGSGDVDFGEFMSVGDNLTTRLHIPFACVA